MLPKPLPQLLGWTRLSKSERVERTEKKIKQAPINRQLELFGFGFEAADY